MFNSNTDNVSNLTYTKRCAFVILCIVALLAMVSQSVQADVGYLTKTQSGSANWNDSGIWTIVESTSTGERYVETYGTGYDTTTGFVLRTPASNKDESYNGYLHIGYSYDTTTKTYTVSDKPATLALKNTSNTATITMPHLYLGNGTIRAWETYTPTIAGSITVDGTIAAIDAQDPANLTIKSSITGTSSDLLTLKPSRKASGAMITLNSGTNLVDCPLSLANGILLVYTTSYGSNFGLTLQDGSTLVLSDNKIGIANTTMTVNGSASYANGSGLSANKVNHMDVAIPSGSTLNATNNQGDGAIGSMVFAGNLSGDGALVVSTVGTKNTNSLTLGHSENSFTGTVSVTSGKLQFTVTGYDSVTYTGTNALINAKSVAVSSGATIDVGTTTQTFNDLSGAGSITNNGTLTLNSNNSTTFSGSISGSGSLTKTGAATLELTGISSSFTGDVTINSGTLKVTELRSIGVAGTDSAGRTITVNSGTTLQITTGADNAGFQGTFNLYGGTLQFDGSSYCKFYDTATVNLTNGSIIKGNATGQIATRGNTVNITQTETGKSLTTPVTFSEGGNFAFRDNTNFNVENITGNANSDLIINATIADYMMNTDYPTSFTKSGAGTMELTAQNSYTGATTISEGTLKLSGNGTLGSGSIAIKDGATLLVDTDRLQTSTISGAGTIEFSKTSAFKTTGTQSDFTGKIVVDDGASLQIRGWDGSTESIATDDLPNASLELKGNSNLVLMKGTGWHSSLTIKDIQASNSNSVIRSNSNGSTENGVVNVGSGSVASNIGVNGVAENNRISIVKTSDGSEDGGTLTLSGNHYYTGGTTVNAGTLQITGNASLGTGSIAIKDGATLLVNTDRLQRTTAISGAGTIEFAKTSAFKTTGTQSDFTGKIVVDDGASLQIRGWDGTTESIATDNLPNATLELKGSSNLVLMRGSGWHSSLTIKELQSADSNSVIRANVSGSSENGVVNVGSGSYAGSIGTTTTAEHCRISLVKTSDGSEDGGTLTLSGNNYSTGGTTINAGTLKLTGNATLGTGEIKDNATLELAGTATISNVISGTGQVIKTGTGTVELTNQNTFTGNVTVTEGVLKASKRVTDGYSAGALGNANTEGRTITVESNGTLEFADINVLGGAGCTDFKTRVIVDGGTIQNSNAAFTLLNNPDFKNGATLIDNSGFGDWKSYMLNGKVSITADDKTKGDANQVVFKIGTGGNACGIYFHNNAEIYVDDVTGNDTTDLLVDNYLVNSPMGTNCSFTKTGSGTMELTRENINTGDITVSEGVLKVTKAANGYGNGALGNIYTDRTITVGDKGEILFTTINVLGGDTVTGIKAKVVVDGGKLSTLPSTNTVFVALTDATLKNGGQIIDNGGFYNYKAYILHGTTTVSADDVTKGVANQCKLITTELGGSHGIVPDSANSIFDVADVTGDSTTDLLVSAFISDSVSVQGRIYKTGLGTMELTYENNYSAGTTVENGILKVSGNGTLGSADVNLLENGTLEFSPSEKSTKTVGNKITGAGQLVKTGAGTTELTNQNSFTGNIVVSEGVLKASKRVTDGYSAGALGDANVDGRIITVESNGTLEFADINVLGGAGCSDFKTRVIVDGGTVQNSNNAFTLLNNPDFKNGATLIDNNGYAGGWKAYMFNGKVSITADDKTKGEANQVEFKIGTNGDANGIYFHNNAEIYVDDVTGNDTTDLLVNDYLVNSPMGTNGSFTKTGSGTMELTYANVYSGGTTISEGTLKLSGNGTLGTGPVTINENGTLEYDVEIAKNITNTISGSGTVLVTGSGTLDMSQDVTAKQLNVDASTLQMADGKTLTGSMTIGENGKLEIGSNTTPATATITSNLTVDADGKLNFDFSTGKHDVLKVGEEFNFADNAITLSFNEGNESDWFTGLTESGYQLIAMTGNTLTGDLSQYLDTNGLTQDWGLTGLPTGLYLTAATAPGSGVPEPSTWALLILGSLGLMWLKRTHERQ